MGKLAVLNVSAQKKVSAYGDQFPVASQENISPC